MIIVIQYHFYLLWNCLLKQTGVALKLQICAFNTYSFSGMLQRKPLNVVSALTFSESWIKRVSNASQPISIKITKIIVNWSSYLLTFYLPSSFVQWWAQWATVSKYFSSLSKLSVTIQSPNSLGLVEDLS